jgi:hypothetical protein
MSLIFVARSAELCEWGSDVGLGKTLFLLGLVSDVQTLETQFKTPLCGCSDWTIIKKQDGDYGPEDTLFESLSWKEKMIDPSLYPRLKGQKGVFRIKLLNVENHLFVKKALVEDDHKKI